LSNWGIASRFRYRNRSTATVIVGSTRRSGAAVHLLVSSFCVSKPSIEMIHRRRPSLVEDVLVVAITIGSSSSNQRPVVYLVFGGAHVLAIGLIS